MLDFGCVEQDSKISFRVRDWDYFSDEVCLGPLDILGTWPASAEPSVVCKEAEGKGCISFTLFYGPDVTLADATGGIADTTGAGAAAGTTITNPTITPTTDIPTTPSRPDTPDAPLPTVVKRPANATHTPSTEEVTNRPNPITPPPSTPTPRVRAEPGGLPLTGAPVNSSTAPPTTTDSPLASTKTRPSSSSTTDQQPRVQGSPPPPPRTEEKEKSSPGGGNSGAKKSAAVAGSIIGLLAFVGVGVGVYSSRRRRRAQDHNQGLELDDPAVRGQQDEGGAGSIVVL